MSSSKINQRYDQYVLRGKLRHEGYERWRYVFSGTNTVTSREKRFFIELYIVNPGISPKAVVIGQKSRLAMSEADLKYVIEGKSSAQTAGNEIEVKPSYVAVKAGFFGQNGKQINKFFSSSQLTFVRNSGTFKVGDNVFSSDSLSGSVEVSEQELRVMPELLCSAGSMKWDLKFDRNIICEPLYNKKMNFWAPFGAKSTFIGTVVADGQEYAVSSRSCNGYSDKSWGQSLNSPYFHISSAKLTSLISGKSLLNSCVTVEGNIEGTLYSMFAIEGTTFKIKEKRPFKKQSVVYDCSQMPESEENAKVHWSMSVTYGQYLIDLDIYCRVNEMIVRDYEIPQGKRCLLKILGGGNGTGEIRIYRTIGKNIELLEHANIYDALCEFGETEKVGKV